MTTDAKIGLLLGLVFIVIIAFVINGLPSFHRNSSSNDLTNNYVTQVGNKPIGLADGNRQGLESINDNNISNPLTASAAGKTGQSSITQVNNVIETTLPINETAAAQAVDDQQTTLAIDQTKVQADTVVAQAESEIVPSSSSIYVVKKGDNLGLIAQNCYGTQGTKRENVTKIVKTNHLKSEGQIYIGQKLVIPNPTTLSDTKPSMFEKVKSISKNLTGSESSKESSATSKGLRDYVVKSGDYPWKIAAKELGSGSRYKEILKYNPNINEKTTLSVGMHLKLPQR